MLTRPNFTIRVSMGSSLIAILLSLSVNINVVLASDSAEAVSYHRDVLPIFRSKCFGCHQPAKALGDYRMTDLDGLLAGGESEVAAIVPGKPDESFLVERITPVDGVAEMPEPPEPPLSSSEIETIRRWISEGANDDLPRKSTAFSPKQPPTYAASPTVPALDISPDGSRIAIAGYHEVLILEAETGDVIHRLIGRSPRIAAVAFSSDGSRLAVSGGTSGEVGEVQVWDIKSGELDLSRNYTYDTLRGIAWSPDGTKLAFGAADNVVRAIDSSDGSQVLFQGAHEDWILDTVFTPDGAHLVSVARDMTCKLTEVDTERFVDNITSITPGALSGGLSSLDRHPTRNEIVVGGSDGVAKVYRVFRETTRRIGDDANLIRNLPKLEGRITAVDVDNQGRWIAAASTLDGESEIQVWDYDFDGSLDDATKKILGKRVSDRSADEKSTLEKRRNQETKTLIKIGLPDVSVFDLRLDPNGGLWVAGNDGLLRKYSIEGELEKSIKPFADYMVSKLALAEPGNSPPEEREGRAQKAGEGRNDRFNPVEFAKQQILA
ncbi:MAG: c-type cytochrome domain-containing protein, partial [Planctomycetota bacterium]